MIDKKIKELEDWLNKVKDVPENKKKEFYRETLGEADIYISKLLTWLRRLKNENNL